MGGENYNWNGTPLIVLYEKHIRNGKSHDDAVSAGGKDAGWIAKKVINDDTREFQTETGFVRRYRWNK